MPLVLLSVVFAATACGTGSGSSAADNESLKCSKAPAASGAPVPIRIGYGKAAEEPVWLMSTMPSVAPHAGKSYTLKMRGYDDADKKAVAAQAHEVDAVIIPAPNFIVGTAKKALDLVALFTVTQEAKQGAGQITFVTKPGSGISSVKDLKGKNVGINDSRSAPAFVLRLALQKAGLDIGDVNTVTAPFPAQIESLNSGVIDAAVVVEPFTTLAASSPNPPKVLFTSHDATGYAFDQLIMAVDREFSARNLRAVCDFRDDYAKALAYYKQHRDEARQSILAGKYVGKLPFTVYRKAKDFGQPDGGRFDPSTIERLEKDLVSVGLLKQDQQADVKDLYAPGFTAGH
ncbi:ABC transporter substrate-binding protein [Streptomyces tuirus]|uniref:ABC transporter substrate-binding protein n=1 Tax=Streptomyces tuirus TaxID=68278 RepID=A0A941IZZ8_9ACTN|nr:ABC transporter substrate-binding protein [Streptomyces tuirus]